VRGGPGGAGAEDREGILALSSLFRNDWIPYAVDNILAQERGGFYVAELDGRVVAVCAAAGRGETAWLQAMRVDPDFQGRGVATALTAYVLDECLRLGCRSARLFTAVTNDPV
jgi:GNAT superfamily N-acetyltransferase